MKFQKYLANTCVAEWKLAYVDYKGLKKYIKLLQSPADDLFIRELQIQVSKISIFYNEQCSTLPGRLAYIQNLLTHETHSISAARVRIPLKDIKYARYLSREYHRYCSFLINFQKLNKIAFVKILKKYDKVHSRNLKENLEETFLSSDIFKDVRPKVYAAKVEEELEKLFSYMMRFYPKAVHSGIKSTTAKSTAMKFLRGSENTNDEFAFFRVGMYIGIGLVLLVFSIIKITQLGGVLQEPVYTAVLHIYGGMFIVVLSFFGFAFDLCLWKKNRINYIFIFELNTNHNPLTYKQFTEFAAWSFLVWSLCLYFTFYNTLERWISFRYLPLLLIGMYVSMLFLPLKLFYYPSRKWFVKTIFHVFTPGFRRVSFKDFFIADLMISLTFFWASVYMTSCLYFAADPVFCSPRQSWITPALISVPLLIRFVQCCRRYVDMWLDKDIYNACKYLVSIIAVYASSWAIISNRSIVALVIWLVVATASAIFSYTWDVVNDWNITSRDKIIPRRYIRGAVVLNLLLRFNWVLTISTFIIFNQLVISFAFGCLEVVRRYMWALFRLETEHTLNMEQFRATKDIPLLETEDDDV